MKVLDLFSGLGGFSLGLERTGKYRTIAFCEMDKYCKLVLQKHWKGVKIYNDVKEITKARFEADGIEFPEVITGGFPCQPFSVAGKQKGTSDDRHLWPEMFRIIQEFKPRWVIGENVKGLINLENGMVFETVCTDLEGEGYEVRAFNIPAAGVGAPHRRERIWIVANSRRTLRQRPSIGEENEDEIRKEDANQLERSSSSSETNVANANTRLSEQSNQEVQARGNTLDSSSEDVANANSERPQGHGEEYELRKDSQEIKASGSSSSERVTDVANAEQSRSSSESIGDIGGLEEESRKEKERRDQSSVCTSTRSTDVANANSERQQEQCGTESVQKEGNESQCSSSQARHTGWESEPDVGRVAHGVPGRVHRLKALGNSIIPKIAEEIGKAIIEADDIEYQGGGAYKAMLKLFRDNLK